jgi:hypothetical protein
MISEQRIGKDAEGCGRVLILCTELGGVCSTHGRDETCLSFFVSRPGRKRQLGRHKGTYKDNIKRISRQQDWKVVLSGVHTNSKDVIFATHCETLIFFVFMCAYLSSPLAEVVHLQTNACHVIQMQ